MAIRKKTASPAKGPEYKNEICDNCELATWVTHLHQHIDQRRGTYLFDVSEQNVSHCTGL